MKAWNLNAMDRCTILDCISSFLHKAFGQPNCHRCSKHYSEVAKRYIAHPEKSVGHVAMEQLNGNGTLAKLQNSRFAPIFTSPIVAF